MSNPIGDYLAKARKERGWTQMELAEYSGVRQATISRIEAGKRWPNGRTLRKLCNALGLMTPSQYLIATYKSSRRALAREFKVSRATVRALARVNGWISRKTYHRNRNLWNRVIKDWSTQEDASCLCKSKTTAV